MSRGLTVTHTYAELEISAAAYDEIAAKLRAADYGHVFIESSRGEWVINMHGIGLSKAPGRPVPHHGSGP